MKYASILLLCLFAASSFGAAISVTYSPADTVQIEPSQDTWIWTGSGPYGSSAELRINREPDYDQRPVLQWDLSSLDGYTINSADMYVYCYDGYPTGTLDADIYRVTESWDEATLVAPLAFDDATVWASGDAGVPSGWKTYDVTDLVQAWVDGDYDNYGVVCLGYGSSYYQRWYSKEAGSNHPYLDIDYTPVEPDTDPPYVEDLAPDDGDTDTPIDTDIVFHCKDDDSGVDTTTIDFTVQDTTLASGDKTVSTDSHAASVWYTPVGDISGDLDIDDADPLDVVCTFTPDDDLPYDETITCTVDGALADEAGNDIGDDFVWTFDVELTVTTTTWGAIKAGN
ncbi:MAG TPA: DNRLRE domain-containing protein [bacterium]|nr:DNRLRE domain-containing protein [bacterium]